MESSIARWFLQSKQEVQSENLSSQHLQPALKSVTKSGDFELTLFASTAIGDGQQANNPWLQELPDPITRASWDNYLTISQADATALGFCESRSG